MLVERSLPECVGDYEPPGTSSCCSSTGWKLRATELIQYRIPVVSRGPSLKRWPRCAPQFLQTTSVRLIKSELSSCNSTFSLFTGSSKLGHPVPDSNLASDENSGAPQATHSYMPFS